MPFVLKRNSPISTAVGTATLTQIISDTAGQQHFQVNWNADPDGDLQAIIPAVSGQFNRIVIERTSGSTPDGFGAELLDQHGIDLLGGLAETITGNLSLVTPMLPAPGMPGAQAPVVMGDLTLVIRGAGPGQAGTFNIYLV